VNESSLTPHDIATRTGSATVEITCPAWCQVAVADHAAQLWANEGRCRHQVLLTIADPTIKRSDGQTSKQTGEPAWEQDPRHCPPIELALAMTTNPAGREVEPADVVLNGQESNLHQLALLVQAITDLNGMYRASPGRST
jgi:hypothetical protein